MLFTFQVVLNCCFFISDTAFAYRNNRAHNVMRLIYSKDNLNKLLTLKNSLVANEIKIAFC